MKKKLLITTLFTIIIAHTGYSQSEEWIWAKNSGGIFNEARGESIVTDIKDNVIVAGSYSCPQLVFGNITLINNGGDDLFVVKFDSSGNAQWAASAGDDYAEECHGVASDQSGNVYICGEFWSPSFPIGDTTLINSGSDDIFVAKYDALGNFQWVRSATGSSEDVCNDISVDPFGNVYIVGSFSSPSLSMDGITLTNTNSNYEDLFIIKLDGSGNTLWASNPAGANRDQAFGIATDLHGNFYVTGNFRSSVISFGGVTIINSGGDDMFIVKYDSAGNALWGTNAAGGGYDYGFSIAIDAESNAYVTGFFSSSSISFGNSTLSNMGGNNVFLAKYDSSGNALWAHQSGQSGFSDYDYGLDVATGPDLSVTISGYDQSQFISFGNDTLTNADVTGFDFFLVRYDSSGNVLWATNSGNSTSARGYACGVDGSGNAYITGTFGDASMTLGDFTLSTSGGYDMYIAKYGLNCSIVFYADVDDDGFGNVSSSTVGCTAPVGYVTDSTDCNDLDPNINPLATEITNNGIDDDCDGIVDEFPTAITSVESNSMILSLNPNPSNGSFTIELGKNVNDIATVQIIDQVGKVVMKKIIPLTDGIKEISFDRSLSEGIYLVRVILNDKIYSHEIVYQK